MIIRLKHIHRVRAKGRDYYYFRPTKEPIKAAYGKPEFVEEYNRLAAKWAKKAETRGTLGALMEAYRGSPEFASKAEATKADYLDVMDYLASIGHLPLSKFDTPFVMKIRDKAFKKHKRRFANYVLAVLSILFNWGMPRGHTTANPVEKAEKIAKPRNAREVNRPWTMDELDIVLMAMPDELRVAVALGAYAGIRQGDVIALPWSAYDGDVIESRAAKTGEPIWVPAHRELRTILDEAKAARPRLGAELAKKGKPLPLTIVVGQRGDPFTGDGFRARFFKVIRELVEREWVRSGLTFHGLRHTAATMLADAGCDNRDIQAITGHKTEAMVAKYTRKADQKRRARAAIAKLEEASEGAEVIRLKRGRDDRPRDGEAR